MKILKEGRAHKKYAWFHTCDCCTSELRIIEGDPQAGKTCYNCDALQYYIRYICPVCGPQTVAYTNSVFGKKANARYEAIVLVEEDRKEKGSVTTTGPLLFASKHVVIKPSVSISTLYIF